MHVASNRMLSVTLPVENGKVKGTPAASESGGLLFLLMSVINRNQAAHAPKDRLTHPAPELFSRRSEAESTAKYTRSSSDYFPLSTSSPTEVAASTDEGKPTTGYKERDDDEEKLPVRAPVT